MDRAKGRKHTRRILRAAAILLLTAAAVFAALVVTPYQYPSFDDSAPHVPHLEKLEALQAPEWRLKLMSTDALIESAITYPLASDMLAWSSLGEGYGAVSSWSNVFQNLESREDAPQKLIRFYENYRIEPYCDELTENRDKLFYLEIILLQDRFWDELSGAQKLDFQRIAVKKYEQKLENGYPPGAAAELQTIAARLHKDIPLG